MNIIQCRFLVLFAIALPMAVGCTSNLALRLATATPENRVLAKMGTSPESLSPANQFAQGRNLEQTGQIGKAMDQYFRLVRAYPRDSKIWHRMAVTYDKAGQRTDAATCYKRAMALDPNNAELLCDYGYSKYLQNEFAAAEQFMRQALKIDPELHRAHNNLGLVLAKSGFSNDAIAQFQLAGCDSAQAQQNLLEATRSKNSLIPADSRMIARLDGIVDPVASHRGPSTVNSNSSIAKIDDKRRLPTPESSVISASYSEPAKSTIMAHRVKPKRKSPASGIPPAFDKTFSGTRFQISDSD